jgi:AraC-like DNA-binding protein
VQRTDLDLLQRGIRRAAQKATGDFLSFDRERRISWGYETRRAGTVYSWDGMKRGRSSSRPQVIFQFTFEGRGEYAEGGKIWPVEAGQAFTVLFPSAHRYYLPADSSQWTFFWFIVEHPLVSARISELRKREAAVQAWNADSPALRSAALLFEAACRGQIRDVWTFEELLFSWLLETEREMHQRRYPRDERQPLLDEIRRLVRERLLHPPSAAELAALHQLDRTTFSRKFKSRTGISPAAFVTEVRLEEALKLLRTDAKLEEVAASTGFADANHFCKVFRRHFHSSPGSYRRLIVKS